MIINTIEKMALCKKYDIYLKIIYNFGNKVILQKQLQQYAEVLGMANPKLHYDFWEQLREIEEAGLIKKDKFAVQGKKTKLQVIALKKFAIMHIESKANTQQVGAVSVNNERIMLSVFKNHYILYKVVPIIQKKDIKVNYDNIINYIKNNNSTLLLNKNKGLDAFEILKQLIPKAAEREKLKDIVKWMEDSNNMRVKAFVEGSKSHRGKGKGNTESRANNTLKTLLEEYNEVDNSKQKFEALNPESKKFVYWESYTFNTMLNNYIYVAKGEIINNVCKITLLYFNISNNQKLLDFAKYITGIYKMLCDMWDIEFQLTVGYVTHDQIGETNLINEALSYKMKNVQTKEKHDTQCLQQYLEGNFRLLGDVWNSKKIAVQFSNYDITNNYLEGIKYLNILKSTGRPLKTAVKPPEKNKNKSETEQKKGEKVKKASTSSLKLQRELEEEKQIEELRKNKKQTD